MGGEKRKRGQVDVTRILLGHFIYSLYVHYLFTILYYLFYIIIVIIYTFFV